MRKLDAVITHILTQVLNRWLPLSFNNYFLEPLPNWNLNFCEMTVANWLEFIQFRKRSTDFMRPPWCSAVERYFPESLSYLAHELVRMFDLIHQEGGQYLTYYCSLFPEPLRHISDPPAALIAFGNTRLFRNEGVAVVGSRLVSDTVKDATSVLCERLAQKNMVVVSGGARGVDAASHWGAMAAGRKGSPASYQTIAVMAGGLQQLYPPCNRNLFQEMRAGNALFVSERLWETRPKPRDFPVRNRIITGLCQKLIVMQASAKSGSLASAHLALKQGRDVFVYLAQKDESDRKGNEGGVQLINDGAPFFKCPELFIKSNFLDDR